MADTFSNLKKVCRLDMDMSISENFVPNEVHSVSSINSSNNKLKLNHDLFYEIGLKLFKVNKDGIESELILNVHYALEDIDLQASLKNEKNSKIFSSIKIIDKVDADSYKVSYHVYGDKLKSEDYNNLVNSLKSLDIASQGHGSNITNLMDQVSTNSQNIAENTSNIASNKNAIDSLTNEFIESKININQNTQDITELKDNAGSVLYFEVDGETTIINQDITSNIIIPNNEIKKVIIINRDKKLIKINGRQVNTNMLELVVLSDKSLEFKEGSLLVDFEMKSEFDENNSSINDLFHADYMRVRIYEKDFIIDFRTASTDFNEINKHYASFYFETPDKTNDETLKVLKCPLMELYQISYASISVFEAPVLPTMITRGLKILPSYKGFDLKGLVLDPDERYQGVIKGILSDNY